MKPRSLSLFTFVLTILFLVALYGSVTPSDASTDDRDPTLPQEYSVALESDTAPVVSRDDYTVSPPSVAESIVAAARQQVGKRYVLWGDSVNTFDCSGLVQMAYRNVANIDSPHNSYLQGQQGRAISREEMQPGDLIIWDKPGDAGYHISIFTGEGTQISAYSPQRGVVEDPMDVYPPGTSVRYVTWLH